MDSWWLDINNNNNINNDIDININININSRMLHNSTRCHCTYEYVKTILFAVDKKCKCGIVLYCSFAVQFVSEDLCATLFAAQPR